MAFRRPRATAAAAASMGRPQVTPVRIEVLVFRAISVILLLFRTVRTITRALRQHKASTTTASAMYSQVIHMGVMGTTSAVWETPFIAELLTTLKRILWEARRSASRSVGRAVRS